MEQVPYTLKKSLIPAILLHSPVFSPLKNSVVRDKVFFRHERTYQESITYMGYQLDSDLDFKLYSFIVSKSHSKKDWTISFSRNELFDALNIKFDRDYKKFQSLFIRIERFKDCKFVLEFCKSGIKNNKSDFSKKDFKLLSLIDNVVMSEDKYSIKIYLDYNIEDTVFKKFQKEWIDIEIFSRIKTQSCKAMYLMIQTTKFPEKSEFRISKEKIEKRLCANFKVEKSKVKNKNLKSQTNRIIKNTLNEITKLQIISGFIFDLNSESILFFRSNLLSIELLMDF